MNKKTISISLPQIEGTELKNATVDLKKGVVVAEYGEGEDLIEAKKSNFLSNKKKVNRKTEIKNLTITCHYLYTLL